MSYVRGTLFLMSRVPPVWRGRRGASRLKVSCDVRVCGLEVGGESRHSRSQIPPPTRPNPDQTRECSRNCFVVRCGGGTFNLKHVLLTTRWSTTLSSQVSLPLAVNALTALSRAVVRAGASAFREGFRSGMWVVTCSHHPHTRTDHPQPALVRG